MQSNQNRINQLSVIENAINPLFDGDIAEQISGSVVCRFDKNTGKIETCYDWAKLYGIICLELERSVGNITDSNKEKAVAKSMFGAVKEFMNIPHTLALGIAARKRTKKIQEFYLEYMLSGKYQTELLEHCSTIEDKEILIPSIAGYIEMLCNQLKGELESGK